MLMPALAIIVSNGDGLGGTPTVALLSSATYALLGRGQLSRWAGVMSAVAFNVATITAWMQLSLTSPQMYGLPLFGSMLVLSQIYRRELGPRALGVVRTVALSGAYLSGLVSVLAFDDPGQALLMAAACSGAVVIGAVFRIRSYLLIGSGFLVADLATNVVRFGLSGQVAATVVLTGLGLTILSAMVAWSLERGRLEALLGRVRQDIESWSF